MFNAILGRKQRRGSRPPQVQTIPWPSEDTWPLWFYAREKEIQARRALNPENPKDAARDFYAAKFARLMAQGNEVIRLDGTQLNTGQASRIFTRFTRKLNEDIFGKRYRRGHKGMVAVAAIETTRDKTRPRELHEHIHSVIASPKALPGDREISRIYFASGGGIHKVEPIRDIGSLEHAFDYAFKAYPESEIVEINPHTPKGHIGRGRKWPSPSSPSCEIQVEVEPASGTKESKARQ